MSNQGVKRKGDIETRIKDLLKAHFGEVVGCQKSSRSPTAPEHMRRMLRGTISSSFQNITLEFSEAISREFQK